MLLDKNFIFLLTTIIFIVLFLAASLPLKNWVELQRLRKKELRWINWLSQKPTKLQYCEMHQQSVDDIKCDFCGAGRQLPSLEMVMTSNPKFGIINNSFDKYSHFKTYICSGCGTELYRERYEE